MRYGIPAGGTRSRLLLRRWGLAVVLALSMTGVPVDLRSQEAGEEPARVQRHLGVGNVAFLGTWDPAVHVGYLYQVSLRPSSISTDDLGVVTVETPRWFGHTMVSAGWAVDSDGAGRSGLAGLGQLGLLYRFDGPMTVSRAGVAAQGSFGLRGAGAVVRVGFLHGNGALSLGWMRFEDPRSDGLSVTVEVLRCILQDLGLIDACLVL